jgi:hypothetical protein
LLGKNISLILRVNNDGKNILESAVIRSITPPSGVENIYKSKNATISFDNPATFNN